MGPIIRLLNENNIRYLLIGGQAIRLMGMPRYSMDWDFFIPNKDKTNIQKINQILHDYLDLPLVPIGSRGENFVQTYQTPYGIIQFHLAPIGLPDFDDAERKMLVIKDENGESIKCVAQNDLLESKKKTERDKDKDDIEFLKQLIENKNNENNG